MLTAFKENRKVAATDKKQGSVGISNAFINNRINEEAIGIALTSVFKSEKAYKLINSLTTNILKAKYSSLMLVDEDALRIKYSNHLPEGVESECRVKVGDGISGWAALTGVNVLVKDIESDTRFAKRNSTRYSSNSFMSVPLLISGKVIGVLNVNDKVNGEAFTENDLNTLKIISRYSAIALRNTSLIEKTKKKSIVQQLDKDYYDKKDKYLPVTLKSLKIGPFNKSELYLKNSANGDHNYVLYWKGGDRLFINEQREEFVRKNINKLFVPKNGRKQYLRFMESNLEKVVGDEDTCAKEKLGVAKDIAVNIASDLSSVPDEICNIERAKQWINSVLGLIRNSRDNIIDFSNVKRDDHYLYGHSINVTMVSLIFAYHIGLNLEEISELGLGLFLQDIGMSNVDPLIINKPTKLNSDEYTIVKKHSELGFEMLQETGQVSPESCLLALHHHENFNGSGYPYGLKSNEISLYGRISRIVDVYSAITSDRPYAKAKTSDAACVLMKEHMKGMFDTEVLNNFMDFINSSGVLNKSMIAV
jgi:HD-GYP domain-containing protein (c-di-GMP phosphodiesterase class II)